MADVENIKKSAWGWLPQLYFIEGLPNAIVGSLSVTYYKSMGMGNTEVAMLTSLLYLPWMLKGFWGPLVDAVSTKRNWIISCLSVFLFAFLALAAAQFFSVWVIASAAVFWILGFASATYDISADGFYMLALDERQQSFFVGIRNAFYRAAVLFGQGAMVVIAGIAQNAFGGGVADGWTVSFLLCAAILLVCLPLFKFTLPQPAEDSPRASAEVGEIFGALSEDEMDSSEVFFIAEKIAYFSPLPLVIDCGCFKADPSATYRWSYKFAHAGCMGLLIEDEDGIDKDTFLKMVKAAVLACTGTKCVVIARSKSVAVSFI